ncbi:MAG: hypothetical protein ACI8W8_001703 [Rhodothermales bacterium]|jgi:hypothetical protein
MTPPEANIGLLVKVAATHGRPIGGVQISVIAPQACQLEGVTNEQGEACIPLQRDGHIHLRFSSAGYERSEATVCLEGGVGFVAVQLRRLVRMTSQ